MIDFVKTLIIAEAGVNHKGSLEMAFELIAAVAMGATVIEKHYTLDRTMEGPDHAASLEPDELKQMVYSIRNIEKEAS